MFNYQQDMDSARRHWDAYWAGEILDRPCVRVIAPKDGVQQRPYPPALQHPDRDPLAAVHAFAAWAESTYFGGDAVPFFFPNFGPDIFAGFLGAELEFSFEHNTSWALPWVEDWRAAAPKLRSPAGRWWDATLDFVRAARKIAGDNFGIGVLDLHSNMDCLSSIRGPQQLCMDLLDCPDDVEAALLETRRSFPGMYDALFDASGQDVTGTSSWIPMYCEGKFSVIQCDFVCMIRPEHLRRFVLPALEEEAGFLDRCCYHYDGPDALVHLDDILGIERIHSVQWVPGAGNPPHIEWMDLLKKIQDAGKSLYIAAAPDEVKVYAAELRPEKVFYDVWAGSQAEADGVVKWLVDNT